MEKLSIKIKLLPFTRKGWIAFRSISLFRMGLNDLNEVCVREYEELSGQNYDGITSLSAWFLLRKLVSIPRRDNPAITYSDTLSADYNHHFEKFQPVSIWVQ